MSLIHTCRLKAVNPFDYLLATATHAQTVKLVPQAWLPRYYPQGRCRHRDALKPGSATERSPSRPGAHATHGLAHRQPGVPSAGDPQPS